MRQLMDDENRAAFSIEDVMGRCRQLVDAKYEVQQEVQKARQDTESLQSINDEVRTEIKRLEDAAGKHESELQARQNSLGHANGRIQTLVGDNTAKAGEIANLQEAALAAQEEARNGLEEQERRSKRDLEDKEV